MRYFLRFTFVFLSAVIAAHPAVGTAQNVTPDGDAVTVAIPIEKDVVPEDALDRGTPRGSAVGFLEACAKLDFEKAAQYLDLRNLPDDVSELGGHELARQFNHVLSRSVWLDDYNTARKGKAAARIVRKEALPVG